MGSGPLLCMAVGGFSTNGSCGNEKGVVYTGGIDGSIKRFDIAASHVSIVGHHSPEIDKGQLLAGKKKAVSCLSSIDSNLISSAGWDKKLHLWDVRCQTKSKAVVTIDLPGKAFSMDASLDSMKVVVATSGLRNCFFDIRQHMLQSVKEHNHDNDEVSPPIAKLLSERESSLKYQTRCVKFFPDGTGIAVGSIEGRVAIEYLDDIGISSGKKKYAFKCHRVNDTIYPVNDIAFHPIHGTFATGGADGTVITWDGNNKKKLSSMAKFPTSIACLAFNNDGTQIAIASSYTYEEGERDHPREEIYVRDVLESEVRPKAKNKL